MTEIVRRFWKVMHYRCDQCLLEIPFYLEDGCEGPRPGGRGWVTPSKRRIVPVPFVAGGCPRCQGEAPWRLGGPCLTHVDWNRDHTLHPVVTDLPDNVGRFEYPEHLSDDRACGRPVFSVAIEPRR